MIGIVTTLSEIESQPVESRVELAASTQYIINTDNIVKLKVWGTNDSEIRYKFNKHEDRTFEFLMTVNETNLAIQALADVDPDSAMALFDVYAGATTFNEAEIISTTTAKYYNITDIVWIEENDAGTMSKMWVCVGGFGAEAIFVDSTLAQIVDLSTTGTTSTTTTSTTSTSTSTSSTSTTSTTTTTTTSTHTTA